MGNSEVIRVVGAVIVEDGKVFATQRGSGKDLAGYWEFPGGKVEREEGPQEALAREIDEELGCAIRVHDEIVTTQYAYPFGNILLTTYWSQITGTRPQLREHSEAMWLTPLQLDQLQWAPADLPTVDKIRGLLHQCP